MLPSFIPKVTDDNLMVIVVNPRFNQNHPGLDAYKMEQVIIGMQSCRQPAF